MKKLTIKPNTYILLTVLLLTLPIKWIVAWLAAITVHELSHYICVKVFGGAIYSIQITLAGVEMQCGNLSKRQVLLATICGPVGGLLFTPLGCYFPRTALCSFFLSLYNLLPVIPFDGGNALRILIKSKRRFCYIQNISIILIFLFAIYAGLYLAIGVMPLLLALGIYIKNRKNPCQEGICRVQ